jgi:Transcription factor WhiB
VSDWKPRAACRGDTNPDAWIVTESRSIESRATQRRALRVCRGCPVLEQCRAWYYTMEPTMRRDTIAGAIIWDRFGMPDHRQLVAA